METSRLEIGCAAIKYLVPAGHPAPLRIRDRLDGILRRELPRTLARVFDSQFSDSDPSIWIIQQLDIEAAVNAAGEPEHITRALATQLGRSLNTALQEGNQNNVRHFPNRAAYLASFLSDLAFGTAWSQWYYPSFAGLKMLPVSAALRTALGDDLATGRTALCLLAQGDLRKVVNSLTAQDARRVLERLAEADAAAEELSCREEVARAIPKHAGVLTQLGNEWQQALYLFIAASRAHNELGGGPLKDAALAAVRLAEGLPMGFADNQQMEAALTRQEAASLSRTDSGAQVAPPRSTAFGGIFLLLPQLDELPLPEATRGWPNTDEAAAISLVRWLVLLKCCGRENSERAFYDPLLRDLLLIPPTLSPQALRTWQARLKPEHLQSFFAALCEWQWSRGAIEGKAQLLAVAPRSGASAPLVLIDAARGLWLRIGRHSERKPQKFIYSLDSSLAMLVEEAGLLYSDASLVALLRENFPHLNVIDLSHHAMVPVEAEKRGIDAIVARLDKLRDDLEFLRLPGRWKIARPLDRALSIAAQHLLRGMTWRLPGFAGSNLPYLSRNFLEFAASIEEDDTRHVVRVGRPPLHLILNMTGITRQTYRLSWLDQRPFALFQQE
jgi:hypothetical protein